MPYIAKNRRLQLDPFAHAVSEAESPGELNFQLTKTLTKYLGDTPSYSAFNAAVGALECAKLELYRRMVAPYEDKKRKENGDVY